MEERHARSVAGRVGNKGMYKRILIATDGSELSHNAIASGIELARLSGASVVGVHARPPLAAACYGDGSIMVPVDAEVVHREQTTAVASRFIADIEKAARKSGVPFVGIHVEDASPADAILRIADQQRCDLIVMASHGRKGLSRLLIGSETNKVLAHSRLPVLITR
jgi:nucleotide-binding universal stress UspA family protein